MRRIVRASLRRAVEVEGHTVRVERVAAAARLDHAGAEHVAQA
jgi:hypothetical protein